MHAYCPTCVQNRNHGRAALTGRLLAGWHQRSRSGNPTAGLGYLHTRGADIVDSTEQVVRLAGLSWFGMETDWMAPHGLDRRSLASMLDQIQSLGYNTLRIPFSTQMLDAGSATRNIDFGKNPDLKDKKPIEVLDKIIDGPALVTCASSSTAIALISPCSRRSGTPAHIPKRAGLATGRCWPRATKGMPPSLVSISTTNRTTTPPGAAATWLPTGASPLNGPATPSRR